MQVLEHTDTETATWFTSRPLWYLVGMALAVRAVVFGVELRPDFDWAFKVMADPWNVTRSGISTEASSPLVWIVGDAMGLGRDGFVAAHIALVVVGVTLSACMVARWVSDYAARAFLVAWYAAPTSSIELGWIGKPDPITTLATVAVTIGPRWACVAGGVLLGFNHFEQGVFIVIAAVVVRRYLVAVPGRNATAAMIGGLLVGRVLLHLYHEAAGVQAVSRIDYVLERGPGPFIEGWLPHTPALIFGVFGVLWVPMLVMSATLERRQRVAMWGVFAAVTLPVLITFDITRVHSLVTFPLVIAVVIHFAQAENREAVRRWVPWFLVAATFVPVVNVWGGNVYVFGWSIA